MRVRRNESGETEARCGTCRSFQQVGEFYRSTEGNRLVQTHGEQYFQDRLDHNADFSGQTTLLRSRCRHCESVAQAARRSEPNRAARRNSGERAFGVELELTGPSAGVILTALLDAGINVANNVIGYRATNGNSWELKHDSSVHGSALELASPKLRGQAGLDELRAVCYALQSVGATVDESCGLHVHVDFRGMDIASVKRQALGMARNQANIFRMMAPSRRTNSTYVPHWDTYNFERAETAATLDSFAICGPRGVVNLHAYPRHGSVEFRSHGGSTSFAKIGAWVRFLMKALAKYDSQELSATLVYDTPQRWLRDVGVDSGDEMTLLRFENAAQTLERAELAEAGERR